MAKFSFKLEGVLDQRKNVEREKQRDLAAAQSNHLRVQAELDALLAIQRRSADELRSGKLDAGMLAAHQRFASAMRQKAATLRKQIDDARGAVAIAQVALVEAAKQRKIMEKLREREHGRWTLQERKRDAMESDDIARQQARHADHARI